ncbi:PTS system glucose-specific EIIA component [Lachnospiraceae bacterium]|jgi:glucose-specific phosphotransferase system IIA component|nr:PTS glucose transporter subunit IIA [Lachnospiraceae bacterium]GFI16575.1 PTS system glucose-specific EIIA component [Lachnospiraceae bacterium]GFI68888.1 PTS system glucose-specific EIIA component [Lachnospiraceae bacterium]
MGLFDFMKGKKGTVISAPVKGECIPISEVADPTFAEEILGKGIAIKPADGKITAPADGVITTVFPTGHAIGLTTPDGVEILVHVGLDTVQLKGQFFHTVAEPDQNVKAGDLILEADIDEIRKAGYDTVTPMIICNTPDFSSITCKTEGMVEAGEEVITCVK